MRFIQVGVGGFGGAWVNCLAKEPRARVVGMVDVNAKALEKVCEAKGYSRDICFTDLDEALAKVEADALVCVTPPEHHRATAVKAMKAGLHVISEKPMAATPADCRAMVAAAERTGRICVISQNYRYSPPTWTLADLVRKGVLGEIGQVKIDFFMGVDFGGGFRHSMDHPLLVDMSIHHFDLIRFVTGLDAVSVRGEAWNPPWSNYRGDCSNSVVFEMENGARVLYNGSWCAKGQYSDWNGNWQLEGSKGALIYERGNITLNRAPRLYGVKKTEPMACRKLRRTGQPFVLDDFLTAVRKGVRPRTDVADNIRSVSMVFAAVKAVKSGRRVAVTG